VVRENDELVEGGTSSVKEQTIWGPKLLPAHLRRAKQVSYICHRKSQVFMCFKKDIKPCKKEKGAGITFLYAQEWPNKIRWVAHFYMPENGRIK